MVGRRGPHPVHGGTAFSGATGDYFAPDNWQYLDDNDIDVGGTGPMLVDLAGATPSQLLVGLGKDGNIYLTNRASLGGVGGEVAMTQVSTDEIINAAAAYTTPQGSYVVFKGQGASCPAGESGNLTAVTLVPGSPPTVSTAWCAGEGGLGSPMVTTTDGENEAVVWSVGAEGDECLRAFDGGTGQVLFTSAPLGSVRRYVTPVLAKGRIFVPVDRGGAGLHPLTLTSLTSASAGRRSGSLAPRSTPHGGRPRLGIEPLASSAR